MSSLPWFGKVLFLCSLLCSIFSERVLGPEALVWFASRCFLVFPPVFPSVLRYAGWWEEGGWSERGLGPGLLQLYRTLHSALQVFPFCTAMLCKVMHCTCAKLCIALCNSVQGCALRNNLFRCWLNWSPTRQVKGEGGPSTSCTLCAHPTSSNLLHCSSALSFPVLCT